jgi:DNA-binding NarL/FixJ family response regulator
MTRSINIILIDDNIITRSALKQLLLQTSDFKVVNEGGFVDITQVVNHAPCVVILRFEQKDCSKLMTLISDVRKNNPSSQILILAQSSDDPMVMWALKSGVKGCLVNESTLQDLENAIKELANGSVFIPSSISRRLIQKLSDPSDRDGDGNPIVLPTQQLRVLKLICRGLSNEEIAHSLTISKRTVDMHTYKLFKRLNVSSRTQAIHVAMQSGLVDILFAPLELDLSSSMKAGRLGD